MRSLLAWGLAVVLVSSGGCAVQHRVVVSARDLYASLPERQAKGSSRVTASDITDEGVTTTQITLDRDAKLGFIEGQMRLADLDRGCRGGSKLVGVAPVEATPAMVAAAADPAATAATAAAAADPAATAAAAADPAATADPATTAATPAATADPATTTPTAATATPPATPVAPGAAPADPPTWQELSEPSRAKPAASVPPPTLLAVPPDPNCPLLQYADAELEVRRYDVVEAPSVSVGDVITIGILAGLAGAVTCELACDEDSDLKLASDITLIAAGSFLAGALIWAILDCRGRWGQPGCRD